MGKSTQYSVIAYLGEKNQKKEWKNGYMYIIYN